MSCGILLEKHMNKETCQSFKYVVLRRSLAGNVLFDLEAFNEITKALSK